MSPEREQFLADILIGAVEGGTGYWACVSSYKNSTPSETQAVLHEALDDDEALDESESIEGGYGHYPEHIRALANPRYEKQGKPINLRTVQHGLSVIESGVCDVADHFRKLIRVANRENDASNLDAGDCDCIIQAGLFGQIVYG